jgi:hypothetical protein
MRTYLGFKFKRRLAETLVLKEAMAIIGCLIVVLAGMMLLYVDKAQAVAGTSVSSPTVSTYPETILARNNNTWDFQFTATNALSSGSVITVNYPADFKINNDEDHKYINFAANRIYEYIPIVTVNDLAASSIVVSGQQLQIQIANTVSAGSVVKLSIIKEAVSNPVTGGTKSILLWTSSDTDPVSIPVTIESSTLTVVLSKLYEGIHKVNYKLTFQARQAIDSDTALIMSSPMELDDSLESIDPSKVRLNGIAVSRVGMDGYLFIEPSSDTHIAAGQTVTLEFTEDAGINNPVIREWDSYTQQIGIGVIESQLDWADVTYTKDDIAPTGSVAVHGITAGGTTYSRSILLDLAATDEGSGVIAGYEVSDTDYFYGFDDRLEYKNQIPYLLSSGAGPKTIYVRFYDAAKNPSVTYQITVIYDDKLSLSSMAVRDGNSATIALSPGFSDAQYVYDTVVSSSTTTVKINLVKSTTANIVLDDSRAVYTAVNSTNGEITFSNLGFGSNDLKIRVSAAEGNKDYHLIIFKEGPELQHSNNTTVINNGSIVVLGGKQWVLTDKTKRQLTLLQPYTECAGYDSSNCNWDGYGNSWDTEMGSDEYKFDPMAEDSVAYYLNQGFLNSLGPEHTNLSMYPFDNTIYSTGTVPTRWSDEYRVKAKVGLLSIPQYQSLKGTGVLNRFLGSEWFLMNPAHAGSYYYIFGVDSEGSLVGNWNSKEVHPVVYLKPGMVISGGSGNEVSPYTLTSLSSNAVLNSLNVGVITITPDINKNLSTSVTNSVYTTTVTSAVYEPGAKLTIKSSTGGDVFMGQLVNLNEGANVFTIVVTAPDGATTLTYMLTITRAYSETPGGQQEIPINPLQPIVTLAGGTTIDFTGSTFGPNAKVSVTEVTPLNISGTGMVSAGKTLEFTLTGITIDPLKPVKVSIPTNANANRSKVGIFYYNPSTLSWEYQKTEIDNTGAASAKVTHFSTYGVFEANKVATPTLDSLYTNDTTKQVTLSTSTEGAAIYFTLDGSEPTTASSLYNSSNKPNLLSTQTLKTIAVKNGMVTSDTVSFVGKARKTITNILNSILNKADQNGDNQFDQLDVRALLNQVETVRGH